MIVKEGPSIPNLIATCPVLELGINCVIANGFILEAPRSSYVLTACSVAPIPPIPVPKTIPTPLPNLCSVSRFASLRASSVA